MIGQWPGPSGESRSYVAMKSAGQSSGFTVVSHSRVFPE